MAERVRGKYEEVAAGKRLVFAEQNIEHNNGNAVVRGWELPEVSGSVPKNDDEFNFLLKKLHTSYFQDTVLFANEMNINSHLDNRLQFDFLINIVRKKKRFSKWAKAQKNDDVEVIKEYYGYSNNKARQVHSLLSSDQINDLKKKVYRGGKR